MLVILALILSTELTGPPLFPRRVVVTQTSITVITDPTTAEMLDHIADTLRAFPDMQIAVTGPKARAAAVRDGLIRRGISGQRLTLRPGKKVEFHLR